MLIVICLGYPRLIFHPEIRSSKLRYVKILTDELNGYTLSRGFENVTWRIPCSSSNPARMRISLKFKSNVLNGLGFQLSQERVKTLHDVLVLPLSSKGREAIPGIDVRMN